MAMKRKERKFEQSKKGILSVITRYKRRIEYFFIVTFIFIFLGYSKNAIKTNDYGFINTTKMVIYKVTDQIIENLLPLAVLFTVFVLIYMILVHPKFIKFLTIISIFSIFVFSLLAILIPEFLSMKGTYALDFIHYIRYYLLMYYELFLISFSFILLLIIIFKKTRKWFLKSLKYGIELIILTLVIYFSNIYKKFNFTNFLKDYWNTFKKGLGYLRGPSDIIFLFFVVLVFGLIYASMYRALIFHIKEYIKGKRAMYCNFKAYNYSKSFSLLNIFKIFSRTKIDKEREKVFNNTQLFAYKGKNNHFRRVPTSLCYSRLPIIGICVPAYNEFLTILKTINSILRSNYPFEKYELIVVSDGSTDNMDNLVIETYEMEELNMEESKPYYNSISHKVVEKIYRSKTYPNFRFIVKKNGGKFDALNVGLQYFTPEVEYVSMIDADTTLDANAFRLLATNIFENPNIVALAGTVLPRDEFKWYELKKIVLTVWQYFDYLSSFHISRASLSLLNSMMIVSGAFGFFNRDILLKIGGYKESLGEDIFLTLELQQFKDSIIKYIPQAVAYTQVPTTFSMIRKQRMRWFKGLTESLAAFKKIWVKNPKMRTSYFEFKIIEWTTPLLAPMGVIMFLAIPDSLNNIIFRIAMALAIITPLIQGLIALLIESIYRPVKWWKVLLLPIQVFMAPLTTLWRNDGWLDLSSKSWGKMNRS